MHILTFDIEDWYHILDNTSTKSESDWLRYPVRIHESVDRILTLLAHSDTKATFFILGWIARKHPEVVKKIHDAGYEIASHSDMHIIAYEQDRQDFREDLQKSIQSLEDITGEKIRAYRAPGFSIKEKNKWAFETLIEAGIETDCSIFPAQRAHGGFSNFGHAKPCWIEYNGQRIKEFPINIARIGAAKIIFSGGGYFRFFPYPVLKSLFDCEYLMTYFHPRDFDPGQPMIEGLSPYRKFKSYYGLKHTYDKLSQMLANISFVDLRTADASLDWSQCPVKKI